MKKLTAAILMGTMLFSITACGSNTDSNTTENGSTAEETTNLEGTCEDILESIYASADLDEDLREAMKYYAHSEVEAESEEYILGTTEVEYTDSIYSAPMMSSVAYQCVILRVDENQDIEEAKKLLEDNADPIKWVCVEAESTVVVNVGDVILYVMSDAATAEALQTAFLALE